MIVKVVCYAGHLARRRRVASSSTGASSSWPRCSTAGSAADHRYFKMSGEDGAIYLLRHDTARDRWELTMYQAPPRRG